MPSPSCHATQTFLLGRPRPRAGRRRHVTSAVLHRPSRAGDLFDRPRPGRPAATATPISVSTRSRPCRPRWRPTRPRGVDGHHFGPPGSSLPPRRDRLAGKGVGGHGAVRRRGRRCVAGGHPRRTGHGHRGDPPVLADRSATRTSGWAPAIVYVTIGAPDPSTTTERRARFEGLLYGTDLERRGADPYQTPRSVVQTAWTSFPRSRRRSLRRPRLRQTRKRGFGGRLERHEEPARRVPRLRDRASVPDRSGLRLAEQHRAGVVSVLGRKERRAHGTRDRGSLPLPAAPGTRSRRWWQDPPRRELRGCQPHVVDRIRDHRDELPSLRVPSPPTAGCFRMP